MAQRVKPFTVQAWQPDSDPRLPTGRRELTGRSCPQSSIHMPARSAQTQKVQKRKAKELTTAASFRLESSDPASSCLNSNLNRPTR